MNVRVPQGPDSDPDVRARTREAIYRLMEVFEQVADQLDPGPKKGRAQ